MRGRRRRNPWEIYRNITPNQLTQLEKSYVLGVGDLDLDEQTRLRRLLYISKRQLGLWLAARQREESKNNVDLSVIQKSVVDESGPSKSPLVMNVIATCGQELTDFDPYVVVADTSGSGGFGDVGGGGTEIAQAKLVESSRQASTIGSPDSSHSKEPLIAAESLFEKSATLETQLAEEKGRSGLLEEELDQLLLVQANTENENEILKAKLLEAETNAAKLSFENESAAQTVDSHVKTIADLTEQISSLMEENNTLNETLFQAVIQENAELKNSLKDLEDKLAAAQNKIAQLKEAHSQEEVKREAEAKNASVLDLEKQVKDLTRKRNNRLPERTQVRLNQGTSKYRVGPSLNLPKLDVDDKSNDHKLLAC